MTNPSGKPATATDLAPDRNGPDPNSTDPNSTDASAGAPPATPAPRSTPLVAVLAPVAIGSLVAVGLGVYGRLHEPAFIAINLAGFSGPMPVKVWLTTLAFVLGLFQLGSSLVMWGKVPGIAAPSWIGAAHRWSGRLAVLATVPVAVHCLYALGFDGSSTRALVHSLLGCFFYGAFVAKMLLLSRPGAPGWALPVIGGLTFTALTGLWLSSSLWFFTTFGVTF